MSKDNLIPITERTSDELREMTRKGGIASGKVRRQRKTLRQLAEKMMFKTKLPPKMEEALAAEGVDVKEMYHATAMIRALINKAEKGDVKAFNALQATIGEQPTEEHTFNIPNNVRIEIAKGGKTDFASSEDEIDDD